MNHPKRPPKDVGDREKAIDCIKNGKYRYTSHGNDRKLERQVTELDALHVIKTGWRVPKRDEYCLINKSWTYAYEGETLQNELLRVIVGFVGDIMVIVTVVPIQKRS